MAKQKDRERGQHSVAISAGAAAQSGEQVHGVDASLWRKVLAWPADVLAKMLGEHPQAKEAAKLAADEATSDDDRVKPHLRCPACWGARRGRAGRMKWRDPVSPTMNRRCYACKECSHEWTVLVRREIVDDVEVTTTKVVAVNRPAEGSPG